MITKGQYTLIALLCVILVFGSARAYAYVPAPNYKFVNFVTDTWPMAVIDSAGTVLQRNGLYPGGTPYSVEYLANDAGSSVGEGEVSPASTDCLQMAASDRMHIGNRWMGHNGLGWYDNTARIHDPLLMRYTGPDPFAYDYPSVAPWTHAAANPANRLDPDGRRVFNADKYGHFTLVSDTECEEYDRVIFVHEQIKDGVAVIYNGNADYPISDYPNIDLPKGSILKYYKIPAAADDYDIIMVRGDENGMALFKDWSKHVASSKLHTEFSYIQTGIKGEKGLNFITSSHRQKAEAAGSLLYSKQLQYGYSVRDFYHNHASFVELSPEHPEEADDIRNVSVADREFKSDIGKNSN